MRPEHRRVVDRSLVVIGVVTLIAQAWPLDTVHPAAAGVALALLTCLPWLWRDRFPNATLAVSGAGLIAVILLLRAYDWASAVTIVLLFFVAYDGHRRRSVLVGVATACVLAGVVVALIPVLERSDDLSVAGTRVLAALGALVVGDLVRSRLALRAAAREKTQREIDELRDRADRQATAERLRIARELHDTLAHALVAINVRSAVSAHLAASPEAADALTEIKNVSAQALTDLRATLDVLRERDAPAPRDPVHGLDAVPRLLDHAQAAGLNTQAEMSLDAAFIPGLVDHAGYRIVQESLTNVMRHANASCARVRVTASNGMLTIDVTDDGRGTPQIPDGHRAGHGLQGMAERASALGGTVTAGPRPGRGWQVHAVLPLVSARP